MEAEGEALVPAADGGGGGGRGHLPFFWVRPAAPGGESDFSNPTCPWPWWCERGVKETGGRRQARAWWTTPRSLRRVYRSHSPRVSLGQVRSDMWGSCHLPHASRGADQSSTERARPYSWVDEWHVGRGRGRGRDQWRRRREGNRAVWDRALNKYWAEDPGGAAESLSGGG